LILNANPASRSIVMRVRQREQRKEGKGLPAIDAPAAPDANPVVMLVMRLLATTPVTNDRIVLTNGALA
jgi:hypothetical protein